MRRDFIPPLWRTLVLCSLMFWLGGFVFYASAVVPTAEEEIGHKRQGFITRKVAVWINNAAVVGLAMLAVDAAIFPDPRPWRRRRTWFAWFAMAFCQVALAILRPAMDAFLNIDTHEVERGFKPMHRLYLWIHTIQLFVAAAYLTFMTSAWRMRDRTATERET